MKIPENPIQFYTEPTNESDMQEFLKYLHIYVTANYPHLAQVKPVLVLPGIGDHCTVIYQSKEVADYQRGDTKKVFVVDDIKGIHEFIWAIYCEFDTDLRHKNDDIDEAVTIMFNTWQ
jgi:hypothetical protein